MDLITEVVGTLLVYGLLVFAAVTPLGLFCYFAWTSTRAERRAQKAERRRSQAWSGFPH